MSKKEYIDFKKEFMEFAKELENSKPIFDDGAISFDDFDDILGNEDDSLDSYDSGVDSLDGLDGSNDLNDYSNCPNISLETEDILMNIIIKKDYSKIKDINLRKQEFFKDLRAFIDEFESTEESVELMKFYDE